jgi:hypothetical protein
MIRTYIVELVWRLGVLRVELGRRRFGDGLLSSWFVGGRPASEEPLDHVKGNGYKEDGDARRGDHSTNYGRAKNPASDRAGTAGKPQR